MEHSPPPFFKRGPAPVVRLAFYICMSMGLLVLDARFRYTEGLRTALALVVYPLQKIATAPASLLERMTGFFATQAMLREENAAMRGKLLEATSKAQRYEAAEAEAAQLRRLIGTAERIERRSIPAEILYTSRDPYSYKLTLDKGAQHGITPGGPVIDAAGVVGQITRVHTLASEVTLITDKDQAIPVQVVRNGLRAVAFGGGSSGKLELRFMAANADVRNGDRLVTSGIDGTYPEGLPVARVERVERDAANAFARIECEPAAGVQRGRYVLVLSSDAKVRPRPGFEPPVAEKRIERMRRLQRRRADVAR